MLGIRRRQFITLVAGAAAWPFKARAQQGARVRRIGMLLNTAADDTVFQARVGAFLQGLALLGWTIGHNVRIEIRWSGGKADEARRYATELAALAPDVILAHGVSSVRPLLQATRTVPIVFPIASDPVGAGLVESLARPGGKRHRLYVIRIPPQREMAGVAQRHRARCDASGGSSGPDTRGRIKRVCRHSGRGVVARGGNNPSQLA